MKSIKEKAKAYDEAIERAKGAHNSAKSDKENGVTDKITEYTIQLTETIFPELKESEDEKIRKDLIIYLRSILSNKKYGDKFIESWIDWLEKQGEHKKFRDSIQVGDKVTRNEAGMLVNLSQLNRVAKPRQKSTDKVEPKFHESDWVVCEAAPKFTAFKTGDVVQISNKETLKLFLMFEDCFRLWDITKDAKDGDVLSFDNEGSNYHSIGIFKRIASKNEPNGNTYRCYVRYGGFKEKLEIPKNGDELHHCGTSAHPATKEQRNQLEKAMTDAGYTFDFERKELKKIEQKPTQEIEPTPIFKIGDVLKRKGKDYTFRVDRILGGFYHCDRNNGAFFPIEEQDNLELVEQKPAWSEEDETKINYLIALLQNCTMNNDDLRVMNEEIEDWLKSLRPQSQWKPSKRQKEALLWCVVHLGGADKQVLGELLEELNKL